MARPNRPLSDLLDHPRLYRAWQAPFVGKKLAPVLSYGVPPAARVLDVGCGPGINAALFDSHGYVGVDLNDAYIRDARKRFSGHRFEVRDVTTGVSDLGGFDVVLMNSLMHHLDDSGAASLLASVAELDVTEDVHILDLVLPEEPGIARTLALADRGEHPRSVGEWENLVADAMPIKLVHTYPVGLVGVDLWRMVHIVANVR